LRIRFGSWRRGGSRIRGKYDGIHGRIRGGPSIIVDNGWRANVENERWIAADVRAGLGIAVIVGSCAEVQLLVSVGSFGYPSVS